MFPSWALWPIVLLTTVATVIASQAVITGAYSLTRQAIQLGLLPRFGIRHTSGDVAGQIYLPRVNWLLLIAVLLLVVVFKSSSALDRRLWRCRDGDHDHDLPDGVLRDLEAVALAAVAGGRSDRPARCSSSRCSSPPTS